MEKKPNSINISNDKKVKSHMTKKEKLNPFL